MEVKQDNRLYVWVSQEILDKIQRHATKMTMIRAAEDVQKKIPPSRRRRAASLSTAARDLILKGLDKNNE